MTKPKAPLDPVKPGTPAEASYHDGLFTGPEEARAILKAVRNFLQRTSGSSVGADNMALLGFAVEETEVEFRTDVSRVKMKTRYAAGKLLLVAPMQPDESEESLRQREAQLLAEFSTRIHEGQMRASIQFYRTLNVQGRETLMRDYSDDKKSDGTT